MASRSKSASVNSVAESGNLQAFPASIVTITIGRVIALVYGIGPLVEYPGSGSEEPVAARSLVPITERNIEAEVALAFEDQDRTRPLILGLIQKPATKDPELAGNNQASAVEEVVAGQNTLVLTAMKELVLRCGKASITLTREGKLLMSGEYLVSTSSGVNKIRGASVQLN